MRKCFNSNSTRESAFKPQYMRKFKQYLRKCFNSNNTRESAFKLNCTWENPFKPNSTWETALKPNSTCERLYINTSHCPTDYVGHVFWLGPVEVRWVYSFFSHVLCAWPLSNLRNLEKSRVLCVTEYLQDWQLTQIGLRKPKKSRTVCSAMLRHFYCSQQYRTWVLGNALCSTTLHNIPNVPFGFSGS